MTPGGALHEMEQRLARLRAFATMDEAWVAVRNSVLPPSMEETTEAATHQGFDLGYATAMKMASIALAEVQTIAIREK